MDAPATPVPFRITTDGRTGTLEVDGTDITSSVAGFAFETGYGEPSRLTVELNPGSTGVLDGAAVIQVAVSDAADRVRSLPLDRVRGEILNQNADLSMDPVAVTLEVVARLLEQGP